MLLDECLPVDFRHAFPELEPHTAEWAGFKGCKNGELLRLAETAGYDVLLTVDQGIRYQQPPAGRRISVVIARPQTNQLEHLLLLVESIAAALRNINPGEIKFVSERPIS